jgi:hypothetical protein
MKQRDLSVLFPGTLNSRQTPDAGLAGALGTGRYATGSTHNPILSRLMNWRPKGQIPPKLDGAIAEFAKRPSRMNNWTVHSEAEGAYLRGELHPEDFDFIQQYLQH